MMNIEKDLALSKQKDKTTEFRRKYKEAIKRIKQLEQEVEAVHEASGSFKTHTIKPTKTKGGEATAVLVASDWHLDERVRRAEVSGMNCYNLKVAKQRIDRFFQHALVLINICKRDVEVKQIVLALLGDFISGNIHEELAEINQLSPIDAMVTAQGWIASGIEFLLAQTDSNLVIPCSTGN